VSLCSRFKIQDVLFVTYTHRVYVWAEEMSSRRRHPATHTHIALIHSYTFRRQAQVTSTPTLSSELWGCMMQQRRRRGGDEGSDGIRHPFILLP